MKGLHHGRWTMAERSSSDNPEQQALIDVTDLGDPEPLEDPAFDPKLHPREARRRAAAKSKGRKYDFEMVLGLGSTSRGRSVVRSSECLPRTLTRVRSFCRWNKLTLIDYFSINKATGEELPIKLLNQGPFYFSKSVAFSFELAASATLDADPASCLLPSESDRTSLGATVRARTAQARAADRMCPETAAAARWLRDALDSRALQSSNSLSPRERVVDTAWDLRPAAAY